MPSTSRNRSWLGRLFTRGGGSSSGHPTAALVRQDYDGFQRELMQRFSSPNPESDQLRKLIIQLSGFAATKLPRDKARWLNLLVESPYLSAPLEVYKDEFAAVGYDLLRPRDKGAVANALEANSLPSVRYSTGGRGMGRNDLIDDMIDSGALVPVAADFPLLKILTANVCRWSGRRLLGMSALHHACVGEAFWRLGSSNQVDDWPDEALTVVPTDVLETPKLPQRDQQVGRQTGYRLAQTVGTVPEEQIFEWSRPDPRNIYARGRGVVQALGDEVESAEWMSRTMGTFFRNNNQPPSMMVYRAQQSVQDMEKMIDRKHRGLQRFFRMMLLKVPNDSIGAVKDSFAHIKLGDVLDPTHATEYSRWAWEFIRQFLRVPPSLLADYNDNSGLGMSGVELERAVFLISVIQPMVLDFEDALRDMARRVYDERLVVRHRPFVQTDREFQLRVAEAFPDRFTNREIRELSGYGPTGNDAGDDAFLVQRGRIPAADLAPGNEVLEAAARSGGGRGENALAGFQGELGDLSKRLDLLELRRD